MRVLALLLLVAVWAGCGELERSVGPVEGPSGKGLSVAEALSVAQGSLPLSAQARVALADLGIDYTAVAFGLAAGAGDMVVVELFILAGMSVDARGWHGSTALMWSAFNGHLEVVQYLVEQGASLTATNNAGATARDIAARYDETAVVEYLDSL